MLLDEATWEICVVLSSDAVPERVDDTAWVFTPKKNAVGLAILNDRALLARKRQVKCER
jgi:hypothetical protein